VPFDLTFDQGEEIQRYCERDVRKRG
jgi:hypothetical protein